jgi:hypothetical protein
MANQLKSAAIVADAKIAGEEIYQGSPLKGTSVAHLDAGSLAVSVMRQPDDIITNSDHDGGCATVCV